MSFLSSAASTAKNLSRGKIPEFITVYKTDESEISRDVDGVKETADIYPAFICDRDSKTAHKSGENWASGWGRNRSFVREDRENLPFGNIRIWDLEGRGEGGRAYKVITNDGLYIDMREDVFLEALLTGGITPGGHLAGEYVFAIMGSQLRIVRYGSRLHAALIGTTTRGQTKSIPFKELVVGNLYRSKGNDIAVYCGRAIDPIDNKKKLFWMHGLYDYSRNPNYPQTEEMSIQQQFNRIVAADISYQAHLQTSHSFIESIGTIDIGDRTKYHYQADVAKYPADYQKNYWNYYGSKTIQPIFESRTWKFVD